MSLTRTEVLEKVASKTIGVKDYRLIMKFVTKSGLKQPILDMLFTAHKEQVKGMETWATFRLKTKVTLAELKEYKEKYGDDVAEAILENFPEMAEEQGVETVSITGEDKLKGIVGIVMQVLEDDETYELFINLLSSIYNIKPEEVEELSMEDLKFVTQDLTSDASFMQS